ncbi:MAG TPA: hypothetical protein VG777_09845, partial [Thermoanaerobaculia bacterium]|nr:hypothetical protein [Thermoanaerobaculia bacterium]
MTTLEPFGPLPAEELKAAEAAAEERGEKPDVIQNVAVLDVHGEDDAPCTQDEIASGNCDDDEADGSDIEEVPAEDLTKKSTLHSVVTAMKKVGALFRPKSA